MANQKIVHLLWLIRAITSQLSATSIASILAAKPCGERHHSRLPHLGCSLWWRQWLTAAETAVIEQEPKNRTRTGDTQTRKQYVVGYIHTCRADSQMWLFITVCHWVIYNWSWFRTVSRIHGSRVSLHLTFITFILMCLRSRFRSWSCLGLGQHSLDSISDKVVKNRARPPKWVDCTVLEVTWFLWGVCQL